MPAAYVKPYVKRGKTDRADAEAICEAVTRPTMRFVPVKSAEVQAALLDHKALDFLIRQRTQTVNTIRAHLAEFGIVVARGIHNVDRLLAAAEQAPEAARPALDLLARQLRDLRARIETITQRVEAAQKKDPLARRLATIPGARPDRLQRLRRHHARRRGVPVRAGLLRLARAHAKTPFQREQGSAGSDFQGWQPVSAAAALSRCLGPDRMAAPWPARARLAGGNAGKKAREGGRCRLGQPDGTHRLGTDQDGPELPGRSGLRHNAGQGRRRDGEARRKRRRYLLPAFEIRPRRSFPPLERGFGVSPSQAE
jgi:transposase